MKGFGTLYVFELKKVLGQRLLLVSVLLGAALLFGWSLLTFYGTGYYYRYHAQTNSVEQISRSFTKYSSSPLKACTFENNHWTYNGTNAGRWWGQWHRIN